MAALKEDEKQDLSGEGKPLVLSLIIRDFPLLNMFILIGLPASGREMMEMAASALLEEAFDDEGDSEVEEEMISVSAILLCQHI